MSHITVGFSYFGRLHPAARPKRGLNTGVLWIPEACRSLGADCDVLTYHLHWVPLSTIRG